jgi:hypothetical protein
LNSWRPDNDIIKSIGGSAVTLHIYTEDVDKVFNQAVNAGTTILMPVMKCFGETGTDSSKILLDIYGPLKIPLPIYFGNICILIYFGNHNVVNG